MADWQQREGRLHCSRPRVGVAVGLTLPARSLFPDPEEKNFFVSAFSVLPFSFSTFVRFDLGGLETADYFLLQNTQKK
jgi:hypothetical protein